MCPSASGAKFDRACEWGIPVVNMGWLEMMSRSGSIPAPEEFLVVPLKSRTPNSDPKGKGKAKAIMHDVSVINSKFLSHVLYELVNDISQSFSGHERAAEEY